MTKYMCLEQCLDLVNAQKVNAIYFYTSSDTGLGQGEIYR